MQLKKILQIFFIFFLTLTLIFTFYYKFFKKPKTVEIKPKIVEEDTYKSNIIKDVNYTTKDAKGNEYIVTASEGEIDYSNRNILYLTEVKALIKLSNSEIIKIESDYGKYNVDNFDTIFSKNVIINYLDNKIIGEYLDFSLGSNLMIISRNVVFTNMENIMKADVIEINISTKDTKIFMYEKEEKVNIKSKN
jgi:LPS export ABC transporter protein LptC